MEILALVFGNQVFGYVETAFAVVGAASAVAKLTPTDKDNRVVDALLGLLNALAMNPKKDQARL
jgi:hypothetical protein